MAEYKTIDILGCSIVNASYDLLLQAVSESIHKKERLLITYATSHTLNLLYKNMDLQAGFKHFGIVHPDGIGVYLASKILYGRNSLKERITGSDFYPLLAANATKNNWRIFFFGDTKETLAGISKNYPGLQIAGLEEGYNFNDDILIEKINKSTPDILIVGLGCPKQEQWILKYQDKITALVIIAVGDGIKVFSGSKIRGSRIVQKAGFEWVARLVSNPGLYWKRYFQGIPLFIARVVKYKLYS